MMDGEVEAPLPAAGHGLREALYGPGEPLLFPDRPQVHVDREEWIAAGLRAGTIVPNDDGSFTYVMGEK